MGCRSTALWALALLAGCAHVSLDEGRRAHAEGRLDDAERILLDVRDRGGDSASEAESLLAQVVDDRRATSAWLIERALALAGDPSNAHLSIAERRLEQARALAPAGSAERESAVQGLAQVQAHRAALVQEYAALREELESAADCGHDRFDKLRRLAALDQQLAAGESLVPLALAHARACQDADSDLLAAADVAATVGAPAPEADFPPELWVRAARAHARVAHAAETPPSPPPPAVASTVARPRTPPKTSPAEQVLTTALSLFEAGDIYVALVMIDDGIETLEGKQVEALVKQQRDWTEPRDRLVTEYLERAEEALRAEQPDAAASWYERVLKLDAGNVVARDRMRKIDALRKLRVGEPS